MRGFKDTLPSVYLSGGMRGYEGLNKAQFASAAKYLRTEKGWGVTSPPELNEQNNIPDDAEYSVAIRGDIEALLRVDGIVVLPGWRKSEGARFEVEIARSLDLDFYTLSWESKNGAEPEWEVYLSSYPEAGAEGIDQEARRLVYGDRAATYGHPRGDFTAIGRMWGAILGIPDVTPEQVAIMMDALKLARLAKTPTHRDSQVDSIGYMLCLARLQEDPTEIAAWNERGEIPPF